MDHDYARDGFTPSIALAALHRGASWAGARTSIVRTDHGRLGAPGRGHRRRQVGLDTVAMGAVGRDLMGDWV